MWITIVTFSVIALIGFIKKGHEIFCVIKHREWTEQYLEKFGSFISALPRDFNVESYCWLMMNVHKMQKELGDYGIIYNYSYLNIFIARYEILINTLNEISKYWQGNRVSYRWPEQRMAFDLATIMNCFLRYLGHLEECHGKFLSEIKNPFIWFREGMQFIITFFLTWIWCWFGLIEYRSVQRVGESFLMKWIATLSGIVTIIVGWDEVIKKISHLFFWIKQLLKVTLGIK